MKKIRILIVDDMLLMREMMVSSVRKIFPDFEIDVSSSVADAKKKMEYEPFSLVLCDWEMPDVKGNELLRWMRSHPSRALNAAPFIMVTARNDKEAIVEAVKLGVTDYVIKPLTVDLLSKKIRTILFEGGKKD
ncbi:MAG: response regulator [Nitrospirae bacterium]|nr:response regulator [Nitrospirota bacterium]MCL5236559.1 response regulator [Nitrospirota bacterium]